jgi:hypothetical protein
MPEKPLKNKIRTKKIPKKRALMGRGLYSSARWPIEQRGTRERSIGIAATS